MGMGLDVGLGVKKVVLHPEKMVMVNEAKSMMESEEKSKSLIPKPAEIYLE